MLLLLSYFDIGVAYSVITSAVLYSVLYMYLLLTNDSLVSMYIQVFPYILCTDIIMYIFVKYYYKTSYFCNEEVKSENKKVIVPEVVTEDKITEIKEESVVKVKDEVVNTDVEVEPKNEGESSEQKDSVRSTEPTETVSEPIPTKRTYKKRVPKEPVSSV
jgi:hypothetical protein